MAKRFTKSTIDWAALDKRVPAEQKPKLFAFKGKSNGYLKRVLSNPPEPPKINWEAYKKQIKIEGLVERFQDQYTKIKIPFPQDNVTSQIDAQWKTLQGQIKAYCAERQKEINDADNEIKRLNALPNLEDITMEMVFDLYPDRAVDFVNKPSYWPHNPEEQPFYVDPDLQTKKKAAAAKGPEDQSKKDVKAGAK